jgi:hypothetical protein
MNISSLRNQSKRGISSSRATRDLSSWSLTFSQKSRCEEKYPGESAACGGRLHLGYTLVEDRTDGTERLPATTISGMILMPRDPLST